MPRLPSGGKGREMMIRLQSHGYEKAKLAKDVKVGDILIWNGGHTSKVLSIVKETKSQIVLCNESDTGTVHERRLGKERLIAYV